ncbi:DUF1302 family protein [Cupriavidus basilensis]
MQWQVTPAFSLMGYYQFTFKPNQIFAPGSYFSTTDVVGPGAEFVIGPGFRVPRGPDISPSDWGQWGIGGALPRVRGHRDRPVSAALSTRTPARRDLALPHAAIPAEVFRWHQPDRCRFSTQVAGANVAGEVSYKDGIPMLVDVAGSPTASRGKALQAQLSAIYSIGPTFLPTRSRCSGKSPTCT